MTQPYLTMHILSTMVCLFNHYDYHSITCSIEHMEKDINAWVEDINLNFLDEL